MRRTMRLNTKTQRSLCFEVAKAMKTKQPWALSGLWWTVESFRPLENNMITVYLNEFTI